MMSRIGNIDINWQSFNVGGAVAFVDIFMDGYARATFESLEDAHSAVYMLNHREFMGKNISLRLERSGERGYTYGKMNKKSSLNGEKNKLRENQQKYGQSSERFKIFVGGLSPEVTWKDLKDLFRTKIRFPSVDVPIDDEGRSLGFATVYVSRPTDVNTAVRELNDVEFMGSKIVVQHFEDGEE